MPRFWFTPARYNRPNHLHARLEKQLQGAEGNLRLQVELRLQPGEWVALLGPSGAGKTSLLRMLAGLMPPDSGHIETPHATWLDTDRGLRLPVRKRRIGFVFQDYALFPHMSVRRQLAFAQPRKDRQKQEELLAFAGLTQLADALPARLSGGQQQRLALARALASEPDYLFLDEPLSALDTALRQDLQEKLASLRRGALGHLPPTLLIVTHDPGEALKLADRVLLMEHGRIANDTTPRELFGLNPQGPLILNGRVVTLEEGETGPCYRVAAEGHVCRVPLGTGPRLGPGESVFVTASHLVLRPMRLHRSQATQTEEEPQGQ